MAKKIFEDNTEETVMEAKLEYPAVKQMVRTISAMTDETHDSVFEVDAELSSWIDKGYKLLSASYIGSDPSGHTMFYVLVRQ